MRNIADKFIPLGPNPGPRHNRSRARTCRIPSATHFGGQSGLFKPVLSHRFRALST